MKNYVESLKILIDTRAVGNHSSSAYRAAGHLVAAQVVKDNPIAEPAACDQEMREILASL